MNKILWISILSFSFLHNAIAHTETELDEAGTQVNSESSKTGDLETTVKARKPITAASSSTIRNRDLKLRPTPRPADVVAVTPGIFVVQHAGGGKANQYFLRGFDIDHGTDLSISVDGVPVNAVSHGHGQGYSDLHWLIPELVDRIEVLKGPYFAEQGDFSTAGSLNVVTRRDLPENFAALTAGGFTTARIVNGNNLQLGPVRALLAGEAYYTNGPFIRPEATQRFNLFGKFTRDFSASSRLSMTLTGYGGKWFASGQIPERAVNAGTLNRFGTLDPNEGGRSNRFSVVGEYNQEFDPNSDLKAMAFVAYSQLTLFSNFTFFSADPVNGDMIEQHDNRTYFGSKIRYRHRRKIFEKDTETTAGIQWRNDLVDNALLNSPARVPLSTVRSDDISERSLALFLNEDVSWTEWFRSVVGARFDHFWFSVTDKTNGLSRGTKVATQISPKLSLILSPWEETDLFLNYGIGFHSNDARGVLEGATPLSRAAGYEAGARTSLLDKRLDLAAAFFWLNLNSELVFVGDAGNTEAKGPTERYGVEFEARYKLTDWLFADLDINFTKARFRTPSVDDAIPNAPTRLISGGISAQHPKGYFGRLGIFHIGDRPATEDRFLTAKGFTRLDLSAGYRKNSWEFQLALQNMFDVEWREAQFATTSKQASETAASCPAGTRAQTENGTFIGCEDINFTPGAPINIRGTVTYYF